MNWKTHKKRLLQKPGFKQALKENELEYLVARSMVEARINKGLTQSALAVKMKTKQSVISRLESGQSLPSLSMLKRLASVLDRQLIIQIQ
jgi:ribosome-binding protein aMBF1 (putative translation factor)